MNPVQEPPTTSALPGRPSWFDSLIGVPLALLGGFLTIMLGLFIATGVLARLGGEGRPPDVMVLIVLWVIFGVVPLASGLALLKVGRGTWRFWKIAMSGVAVLFLLVEIDAGYGPRSYPALFRRDASVPMDASELRHTVVSPFLQAAIQPGTNLLWCGTFQLAWNEACALTGGPMRFDKANPVVSELNNRRFTKESIDEPSYLAMAGFVRDGIYKAVAREVERKFHGTSFKPRLLPKPTPMTRPQDIEAYACLYKSLRFSFPFERKDEGLVFGGAHVRSFGVGQPSPGAENRCSQILIKDYRGEDDFVIQLKTQPPGDMLVFAKVMPKTNLQETISAVLERIQNGTNEITSTNDILTVPKIHFDVMKNYTEFLGLRLIPVGTNIATDLRITAAVQNTALDLNEKGVELRSEAHMSMGCGKEGEPPRPHRMVFNKPFLVLLKRETASQPYFALWVDNPELLVRWK